MPPDVSASRSLCFADYELDLSAYALRRGGRPVKLEKIPMELLILLVQRAGALLPRSDIQARLWGSDLFVDHDAAINTAIRKIRQALDDDPASPRFVETVVGKGYRFVAAVENRTPPRDAYEPGVEATTPPSRRLRPVFPRYSLTRGNQEFVVEAGESLLGRHPAAEVYVEHPSVSRRHAALTIDGGGAVLRDLGSRNGTFVNGRSIDVPTRLDHGAIIGLGLITLTFVVLAAPPSTKSVTAGRAAD
jgi:DNA-binding winged helix-turn-helix (wHTH) protein